MYVCVYIRGGILAGRGQYVALRGSAGPPPGNSEPARPKRLGHEREAAAGD